MVRRIAAKSGIAAPTIIGPRKRAVMCAQHGYNDYNTKIELRSCDTIRVICRSYAAFFL